MFPLGQGFFEDKQRFGRPIELIMPQKKSIVEEIIQEDSRLKVKVLAVMVNISETSVRRILHDF